MNSSTFGKAGEKKAAAALRKKGYKIVSENYETNGGELDIVAYKRGLLVFAEVKTRSGTAFGTPAQAVDDGKKEKIRRAAAGFLKEQLRRGRIPVYSRLLLKSFHRPVKRQRFDIIEVFMSKDARGEQINIIENAF